MPRSALSSARCIGLWPRFPAHFRLRRLRVLLARQKPPRLHISGAGQCRLGRGRSPSPMGLLRGCGGRFGQIAWSRSPRPQSWSHARVVYCEQTAFFFISLYDDRDWTHDYEHFQLNDSLLDQIVYCLRRGQVCGCFSRPYPGTLSVIACATIPKPLHNSFHQQRAIRRIPHENPQVDFQISTLLTQVFQ